MLVILRTFGEVGIQLLRNLLGIYSGICCIDSITDILKQNIKSVLSPSVVQIDCKFIDTSSFFIWNVAAHIRNLHERLIEGFPMDGHLAVLVNRWS